MRVNIGFSNLSDDALADEADRIVNALTGNTHFPNPVPPLSSLSDAIGALREAIVLPDGEARTLAIETARDTLEGLLQQLGQNIGGMPGITAAMIATSGFKLPKTPTRATQPPPAPGDVRLAHGVASGEEVVRCAPSAGAASYEFQWTLDPIAGPWTAGGASTSTRNMVITGLPRAKDVWVRVRALGAAGHGSWSDPAAILVS